jgi:hypothetical protein
MGEEKLREFVERIDAIGLAVGSSLASEIACQRLFLQ